MTTLRRWFDKFRAVNLSTRQAAAFAVVSGLLFTGLMVVWLTMSTRTALLNQQIEELDHKQTDLTDQINQTWTEIGNVTSPQQMESRARQLGYQPADKIEFLVTTPEVTTTATTVTETTTSMTSTVVTTTNSVTGTTAP